MVTSPLSQLLSGGQFIRGLIFIQLSSIVNQNYVGDISMNSGNDEPITPRTSPFESIRRQTEDGSEYWSARDLSRLLGYTRWEKFKNAIERAEEACKNSEQTISDHFHRVVKMIKLGKSAQREVEDLHLSRYACYLIVQNADPNKPIVALGQTYFAVQTRRQS